MPITESELQLIRDEAEKEYPTSDIKDNWLDVPQLHKQEAYIAGRIEERERTKEIVAAAKGMLDYDVNTIIKIASKSHLLTITVESSKVIKFINALTNYQNKTP